MINLYHTKKKS